MLSPHKSSSEEEGGTTHQKRTSAWELESESFTSVETFLDLLEYWTGLWLSWQCLPCTGTTFLSAELGTGEFSSTSPSTLQMLASAEAWIMETGWGDSTIRFLFEDGVRCGLARSTLGDRMNLFGDWLPGLCIWDCILACDSICFSSPPFCLHHFQMRIWSLTSLYTITFPVLLGELYKRTSMLHVTTVASKEKNKTWLVTFVQQTIYVAPNNLQSLLFLANIYGEQKTCYCNMILAFQIHQEHSTVRMETARHWTPCNSSYFSGFRV